MNQQFRLTKTTDFERVRREGKSYADPLVVLFFMPNQLEKLRIGVAAGRSVGGAVQRNKAKRRIREAVRGFIPQIKTGYDLIWVARHPILSADFSSLEKAVRSLSKRANLAR